MVPTASTGMVAVMVMGVGIDTIVVLAFSVYQTSGGCGTYDTLYEQHD